MSTFPQKMSDTYAIKLFSYYIKIYLYLQKASIPDLVSFGYYPFSFSYLCHLQYARGFKIQHFPPSHVLCNLIQTDTNEYLHVWYDLHVTDPSYFVSTIQTYHGACLLLHQEGLPQEPSSPSCSSNLLPP
mmetsp:Transcript_35448/g.53649  ORF Transcript_35448/g.53649 Transcript_35448/m.53649 type:complete len:130 (-) Transcript_35448:167-556(-)